MSRVSMYRKGPAVSSWGSLSASRVGGAERGPVGFRSVDLQWRPEVEGKRQTISFLYTLIIFENRLSENISFLLLFPSSFLFSSFFLPF